MSYDFDTLFRAYLDMPCTQALGYTTVEHFYDQSIGAVEDAIDDGREPSDTQVWICEYIESQLDQNPDWFETYAS